MYFFVSEGFVSAFQTWEAGASIRIVLDIVLDMASIIPVKLQAEFAGNTNVTWLRN